MPRTRLLVPLVALALALPGTGWTWGSDGHHYIARHYSQHLPPEIDGLRAYDTLVDQRVTDADARKSYTPGEEYRHYIDIDYYPEFFAGTLSHNRSVLEAKYGATNVLNRGILPWAVGEVVTTLTRQFQAGVWDSVAITTADLCHYVGDANQPLHCTKNFDGQFTGNNGIHSRYESTMLSPHIVDLHTHPMAVAYYSSAVDAMFDVITPSWTGVSTILAADAYAKGQTGGQFSTLYYEYLWSLTEYPTRTRIDTATVVTASLVYTAWVNAGRPPVPGSSVGVAPGSLAGARLDAGPTPFRDELTVRFAGAGPLAVDVFDARGARVERLVAGASGGGSVRWRPAARGRAVGPGLYFVRLSGPRADLVRRVTYLR